MEIQPSLSIINLFWEMHFLRKPNENIEPFDPQRIEAHLRLKGDSISPWLYSLIMEMDLVFRATAISQRE